MAFQHPERVVLDPGDSVYTVRRGDDRRARQQFKATLQRERYERAAETVATIVSAIGPIHVLFADDPNA